MNSHPRSKLCSFVFVALAAAGCRSSDAVSVRAADAGPAQKVAAPIVESPAATPPSAAPAAPVATVDDEFVRLLAGLGVTYSAKAQELEIGGWVNMQSGLVEVFACAPQGKTHESVVVLDCVPSGLHAGLLALGLEHGTPVEFGTGDEYHAPTGDGVDIELHWKDTNGVERTARAEDWVWDHKREAAMQHGAWIFAGSFLQPVSGADAEVTYAADYIKSLATTYHDASSILENPQVDGVDDTVYFANEQTVPAVGTPLRAIFRRAR